MELSLLERILQIKDITEKENLLNLVNQEKEKLNQLKNEDSLVRLSIIDFIMEYNSLNSEWKNKTLEYFSKKLIEFYKGGKDISTSILKLIDDCFKEPSIFKI